MALRFLHSADLQLGMPFQRVPGDQGARLRELRLESIERLGDAARAHGCAFVLLAGDVFDANTVDNRVIVQACERLREVRLPVIAIPGNHDAATGPGSVWLRETFRRERPPNLTVLLDRAPLLVAEANAIVLPAPLARRHEPRDTTAHFSPELGRDLASDAFRVGLAHGGVINFDGDYDDEDERPSNLIDPDRARRAALDYLALGDWHGLRRVDERTWYSGTPEPTGFKQNQPGHALVVEIERPGAEPQVTPVPVARTRWLRHAMDVARADDVDRLAAWVDALPSPRDTCVRLELVGTLPLGAWDRLAALLDRMRGKLLYLREKLARLAPRPSDEELAAIASDGYVQIAVERLRAQAAGDGNEAREAALALELLHRLKAQLGDAQC